MSTSQIQQIRGALLMRGHTFASIAAEIGVSRSHVTYVAHGRTVSARVRKAITDKLGRDPWAKDGAAGAPHGNGQASETAA